jgi:hypothetical protein
MFVIFSILQGFKGLELMATLSSYEKKKAKKPTCKQCEEKYSDPPIPGASKPGETI